MYTGALEILVLRHGNSGRSMLAQSVTGHSNYRAVPSQVAAVKHALSPYCYRCPLGLKYPSCGIRCATDIEELIQTTTTGRIAGMMVEPIQGVGGFITPPPEYFQIAAGIVRKTIGDVRGMGLMQALELVVDETAGDRTPNTDLTLRLFEETRKRGLLIGKSGLFGNAVRLAPPLNGSASEVDEALRLVGDSFAALEGTA